ncbi:helix-turn-helix domain-containing protein [Actinomadura meridiana]|uniref:Helix-turn-helix domain-containing protein n=1 Tax=Actinomadura meridiana TaxID=559626 RepID=A0ABP8CDH3_9ACTN
MAPLEITDLDALKALAHPRRQRILQHLGLHGPATSATLARALGLNTGATSYHLRELAKFGFVEESAGRGHGRERWWQAPMRDLRIPPRTRQSEEMRAVLDEMVRLEIADDLAELLRFQERRDDLGAWSDALPHSRGSIRVTLDELREFFEEYIRLLNRYKRPDDETPPGARTMLTRFFAFPAMTEDDEQEGVD